MQTVLEIAAVAGVARAACWMLGVVPRALGLLLFPRAIWILWWLAGQMYPEAREIIRVEIRDELGHGFVARRFRIFHYSSGFFGRAREYEIAERNPATSTRDRDLLDRASHGGSRPVTPDGDQAGQWHVGLNRVAIDSVDRLREQILYIGYSLGYAAGTVARIARVGVDIATDPGIRSLLFSLAAASVALWSAISLLTALAR